MYLFFLQIFSDGAGIGLNYGLNGDNLPSPPQVISLVKSRNIGQVRIFDPNHDVLSALQGSGVQLILGTLDADIPNLANDINFANAWVQNNIVPFSGVSIRCISVGNEVAGDNLINFVLPAIKNLNAALQSINLGQIPVTTTIGGYLLASSYPPSSGAFAPNVQPAMQNIAGFLASNGWPILVTMYPYFAYVSDPADINLQYALLNSSDVFVRDGDLGYTNLFDAMVDSVYAALEKVNGGNVEVVICESGWPSNGNGDFTSTTYAQTYNQNLVNHVLNSGTPKRPDARLETYIFAIFNEDLKAPGVEQNFGLYYPDMTEVYHIDF
uniref:putative glucan endo-1,3-beta-glucosidase GVI n=1 Tax=Erigeron canadensis TaxID=72917 RepID=UPI001CB98751|nr:putative glucan endo-1,3-beta-glucosidase GVI [Erigeron canadensis]